MNNIIFSGKDGNGHFVFRHDRLFEFQIADGGKADRAIQIIRQQFLGYLHKTGSRHNRVAGEMTGKNRMFRIETNRPCRIVPGYDMI